VLPLLICLLCDNFDFILLEYVLSFAAMTYIVAVYMKNVDKCKKKFDDESNNFKQQFMEFQRDFETRWPECTLSLVR
jgi:hypothetical protein